MITNIILPEDLILLLEERRELLTNNMDSHNIKYQREAIILEELDEELLSIENLIEFYMNYEMNDEF